MRMGVEDGFPTMLRLKRVYDMTAAIIGGFLSLPLIALAAVLIKLADPRSPVLYSQPRVGRLGQVFTIHKLRTMRPDPERDAGAVWSSDDDPRITLVGRLLRKFRIDELPQLWNVLVGDMSLVGPRPEQPGIVAQLDRQIPFYSEREYALPGLTGWAQIHCPYGNTVEAARRKLEYDLFYIKNMSPSLDLQIMLRTVRTVLFGQEKKR
jgi:lipopolysaccharide/colanic/teichoic acid biosynthesis glycosyltransferase